MTAEVIERDGNFFLDLNDEVRPGYVKAPFYRLPVELPIANANGMKNGQLYDVFIHIKARDCISGIFRVSPNNGISEHKEWKGVKETLMTPVARSIQQAKDFFIENDSPLLCVASNCSHYAYHHNFEDARKWFEMISWVEDAGY